MPSSDILLKNMSLKKLDSGEQLKNKKLISLLMTKKRLKLKHN